MHLLPAKLEDGTNDTTRTCERRTHVQKENNVKFIYNCYQITVSLTVFLKLNIF